MKSRDFQAGSKQTSRLKRNYQPSVYERVIIGEKTKIRPDLSSKVDDFTVLVYSENLGTWTNSRQKKVCAEEKRPCFLSLAHTRHEFLALLYRAGV